jgi:DNA-directed RNA polymerase
MGSTIGLPEMTLDSLPDLDTTYSPLDSLDSFGLAAERYLRAHDRTIRDQGLGASDGAQAIIRKHLTETAENVKAHKADSLVGKQADGLKDLMGTLDGLEDSLVALVALQIGLQCVADGHGMSRTFLMLGKALETEVWASGLRTYDGKLAARLEKLGKRRGAMGVRRQAVRSLAKSNGYESGPWTDPQRALAGRWLTEVLLKGNVFKREDAEEGGRDTSGTLTISPEVLAYSEAMTAHLLEAHPVPLPLLSKPKPWKGMRLPVDCNGRTYEIPLIRKTCKVTLANVSKAIKSGRMDGVLEALTAIQSVAWSINTPVAEMVRWAYQEGIDVPGLPSKNDVPLPAPLSDEEYEAMSDGAKRLRRKDIASKKEKNRSLIGERSTLDRDLAIADILTRKGNQFYTVYNMDYRGRVYSACHFGFQRQDYVRAMFMFAEGKPLGERGAYWLMVHLANCGDFEKVSKKPFEERVQWVEDNEDRILSVGRNPKDDLWWTEADSPFLFLAACMEYARFWDWRWVDEVHWDWEGKSFVSNIPVSFDGSCSGLQHLAAMTRCEDTAKLVNVSPTPKPSDVYQTVADKARVVIEAVSTSDDEFADVARLALDYGVTRSLVKRNVMTYSYSSPKYGMITQQMDDTMRPLSDQVTLGKLQVHPFEVPADTFETKDGGVAHVPGKKAAKFLGSVVFDTIEATVHKPAEAMRFLQSIAKALAHEGKPVVWHTPLGMPVTLRCPNMETTRIQLYLSDRGVKIKTNINLDEETKGIDKRAASNAIAPSFVHSMDACHLQMVSLGAYRAGIKNMALVHDSFGCLAADADNYRVIIRSQFHWLYAMNDVLQDILTETCEQIDTNCHRMPELPEKGSLDISEVLNADYAFA